MPTAARIALAAPPVGRDLEVARVNGRPVWGSCVTTQSRGGTSREVALRQCVDFELLAQTAEARGIAAAPEISEALRTTLVNRLVETGFEDRYQKPEDLGAVFEHALDKKAFLMHRPDLRSSSYARVNIDLAAPVDQDLRARAIAEKIAARVTGETGLFPVTLKEAVEPFRAEATLVGLTIEEADVPMQERGGLVRPYADALYTLPEVGRAAGPVRTKWGWDVVLWTGGLPPREISRADLAAEQFPEFRRSYFVAWVKEIERTLHLNVERIESNYAKLDSEGAP